LTQNYLSSNPTKSDEERGADLLESGTKETVKNKTYLTIPSLIAAEQITPNDDYFEILSDSFSSISKDYFRSKNAAEDEITELTSEKKSKTRNSIVALVASVGLSIVILIFLNILILGLVIVSVGALGAGLLFYQVNKISKKIFEKQAILSQLKVDCHCAIYAGILYPRSSIDF
jgi:hypothetical protein